MAASLEPFLRAIDDLLAYAGAQSWPIIGLGFSIVLTAASFLCIGTNLIYRPGIVMAVVVFGLAQVGIHLVFFLHLTTSPDNTNNALALAFGFLIVSLIVFGSIWILYNMNHNMMPM